MQQLTSPVMAKGVEDTSFYRFNRLLSLNDVGAAIGRIRFPGQVPSRERAPREALAHDARDLRTTTSDRKMRARIDVLTELAAGWRLQITKWNRMNEGKEAVVDEQPSPSCNDEYLLYQTLLGSFAGNPHAARRLPPIASASAYMQKAGREAKLRTSWANANEAYEAATASFVTALLDDSQPNAFLRRFRRGGRGRDLDRLLNSLSMAAVKFTSPGVPDTYQSNETWDFSSWIRTTAAPWTTRGAIGCSEIERLGDAPGDRVARFSRTWTTATRSSS